MKMLKVENIQKSFGKTEVLKNISFSLEKGEVLAIIGSSGSGKTTLLRCLNFLETPQRGRITVNSEVLFDSSDSVRSGKALAHVKTAVFPGPIKLSTGRFLPELKIAYETYGELDPQKDNAVLIFHALSGDSHVAAHDANDDPGWWDLLVGPGKYVDTNRYFVICANVLGGCRGTTGPDSINPETGKEYGVDFPPITVADIVDSQRMLVESLGIERLLAIIGGSLGGLMALDWGTRYPDGVAGIVAIATGPRMTTSLTLLCVLLVVLGLSAGTVVSQLYGLMGGMG